MEYKTIIDKDSNIIDLCVIFIDGESQYFKLQEGQQAVERYRYSFIKPKWNGTEWKESATEEEIKAYEENNKIVQEPSKIEKLETEAKTLKDENRAIKEDSATIMFALMGGGLL